MSTPDAAAATETATICHLAGTLTASECAGDWFYAAEGERWPFRLAVLDERIPLEGRGNAAIVAAHDRAIERLAAAVTFALTE